MCVLYAHRGLCVTINKTKSGLDFAFIPCGRNRVYKNINISKGESDENGVHGVPDR